MVQNTVASKIQNSFLVADMVDLTGEALGLGHRRGVISQEYGGRRKAKEGHFGVDPGGQMRCPTHIGSDTWTSTAWYPLGTESELSTYCLLPKIFRFAFLLRVLQHSCPIFWAQPRVQIPGYACFIVYRIERVSTTVG